MVPVELISSLIIPPSAPSPLMPEYPIICNTFVFTNNLYYNNMIILIIQIIIELLLIILCISLCLLIYFNINSQNSHYKKILCNLILIIFCCLLFSSIFLWKFNCYLSS